MVGLRRGNTHGYSYLRILESKKLNGTSGNRPLPLSGSEVCSLLFLLAHTAQAISWAGIEYILTGHYLLGIIFVASLARRFLSDKCLGVPHWPLGRLFVVSLLELYLFDICLSMQKTISVPLFLLTEFPEKGQGWLDFLKAVLIFFPGAIALNFFFNFFFNFSRLLDAIRAKVTWRKRLIFVLLTCLATPISLVLFGFFVKIYMRL